VLPSHEGAGQREGNVIRCCGPVKPYGFHSRGRLCYTGTRRLALELELGRAFPASKGVRATASTAGGGCATQARTASHSHSNSNSGVPSQRAKACGLRLPQPGAAVLHRLTAHRQRASTAGGGCATQARRGEPEARRARLDQHDGQALRGRHAGGVARGAGPSALRLGPLRRIKIGSAAEIAGRWLQGENHNLTADNGIGW